MKRYLGVILGALLACLLALSTPLVAQSTPITQAIALLTSGTTTFSIVGINAGGYINWGTGRSANGYGLRDNAGTIQVKNSAGSWVNVASGGGAPADATYITQVPATGLSAEQPLSALATALLLNTTSTGVLSAYTGTSCTNQFPRLFSARGVATCASVSLSADVTGTLPVANGGTGVATLTGVVIGSGTSTMTAATSSTVGQVLRVTGTNTYAFGAVNLADTDAITGTLPVANGGTGVTAGTSGGILGYTGTGTLASSAVLGANRLVLGGGAGATPTPLGSLGTTTTVLHGNAAGAPTFGAVDLSTDVTGSIGVASGGTGQSSYAIGDLLYASGTTALSKLAAVSANSFLRSAGVTTAPVWSTAKWPDAATTGDVLYASSTNQYANLTAVATGSFLRSAGVASAPVWSATTLPNTAVIGDLLYASAPNVYSNLTAVGTGRVLSSAGTATAPVWLTTPSATAWLGPGTVAAAGVVRLANLGTVSARNAADSADLVLLSSTADDRVLLGGANTTGVTIATGSNNLFIQGTTPTISSGFGTSPTIAGNASTFKVTIGSGGSSSGVVLFAVTWANAPSCVANNETTAQLVRATPTTTQVTLAGTMTAADVISVLCFGR